MTGKTLTLLFALSACTTAIPLPDDQAGPPAPRAETAAHVFNVGCQYGIAAYLAYYAVWFWIPVPIAFGTYALISGPDRRGQEHDWANGGFACAGVVGPAAALR